MVSVGWSIFIGVISGVITSVLVWFASRFFQNVIKPEIQALTYQGVKISGTWVGFYDLLSSAKIKSLNEPCYTIYVKQKGHSITGEFIVNKQPNGQSDLKAFTFTGLFKDKNLVIWYKPKEQTRLGIGSYVMVLTEDGRRFEGRSLYIGSSGGDVVETSEYWKRKEE
jgi:hypothetical protein